MGNVSQFFTYQIIKDASGKSLTDPEQDKNAFLKPYHCVSCDADYNAVFLSTILNLY